MSERKLIDFEGLKVYDQEIKNYIGNKGGGGSDANVEQIVDEKIAELVDSAPETLNTLNELAAALGEDPNFATTITEELSNKANKAEVDSKVDKIDYFGLTLIDPVYISEEERFDTNRWRIETFPYVGDELQERQGFETYSVEGADETFETSANKNNGEITEDDTFSYPTTGAVYNFVTGITDEKVDKTSITNNYDDIWENEEVASQFIPSAHLLSYFISDNQVAYSVNEIYDEYMQIPNIEVVNSLINPTPIIIVPTTLGRNKQYNFGERESLNLAFPTWANDGDVIYLTFKSGATPTALTIDTTNTCDIECIPEANTGYEIFGKYNGSIWIINYSEYTVSEV